MISLEKTRTILEDIIKYETDLYILQDALYDLYVLDRMAQAGIS